MVGAITFQLGFKGLPRIGQRPDVLRPTVAFLYAKQSSAGTCLQQPDSLITCEDLDLIAERLAWPRHAGRSEAKVTGGALVFRVSSIA